MRLRHLGALVLALSAAPLWAQTFRGGIQGNVTDTTGAAVPGVQVTATSAATGLVRSATTDSVGDYIIRELPPGEYTVVTAFTGFKKETVKGVQVEVASNRRVDFKLATGSLEENLEVTAAAPLIESSTNTQGGTVKGDQASELPVNGRDFTKLIAMVPGAAADPASVSDSPGSFGYLSVNGNRGRSNNYLLDGTDMNDGFRNDPAINEGGVFGVPATILPVDAVEEFPVLSGVEPEYGRNAGAIVNIVTRSGTNDFHGSAFEYFRNQGLSARNYFNSAPNAKNSFENNQYGAAFGGPLVKDKTFFFLAYEGQQETVDTPSLARVPTQAEIQQAIAANGGVVNPVIAQLLARNPWPAPNVAPDANGNNLQTATPGTNSLNSIIAKIDQRFSSDVLTVRYFYGHSDQSFPLSLVAGSLLPGYNTVTPTTVNLVSASYTHIISPKLLLEIRGGFNRFYENFNPQDVGFNPNSIGLATAANSQDYGLPKITIPGYATLGANTSDPRGRTDQNYHAFANLSYSPDKHNLKFGYEFRRTTVDGYFDNNFRGTLHFNSLSDFIAGNVSGGGSISQGNSTRNTYENNQGLYAQDQWRPTSRLTINYGVRWDYYGVIGESNGNFSNFNFATGTVQPTKQLYPADYGDIGPRVSVIYDISGTGKTVVRAGWGIFYDSFSQDFFVGQLPFNTSNAGPAYNFIPSSFSPSATIQPGVPVFPASTFAGTSDVFTVSPNLTTPRIQNYSANIQQQLGAHAAIQVGYVGTQGRNLFRFRNVNQVSQATGVKPYPNTGVIDLFESTAVSHYNALQAVLKILNWRGLTSTINYTLSKSTDTASDGQDYVLNASEPDNGLNPNAELGPSNFDRRHNFNMYFNWEIGSQKGSGLKSGWAINGVVTIMSGQPFNVNENFEGDFNGTGEFLGRPDLVGNPFAGTGGPSNFLNLTAFQAPCTPNGQGGCAGGQHFGNLGRNAFYGPSYHDVDLSLVKNTALGDKVRLQVRVDVFNVFNHPNFSNPTLPSFLVDYLQNGINPANNRGVGYLPLTLTPDVGSGNPFLGGGGPRNLQLAARILF